MQPDRQRTASYWLKAACQDLIVAEDYTARLPHVACFHAQQAAEKALKAAITQIVGDAPRTHIAHQLVEELVAAEASIPDDLAGAARSLDKFYAPTRYPDALGGADPTCAFTAADALSACAAARDVVTWCATIVSEES